MKKEVVLKNGEKVSYNLVRKKVKNINVRVKPSGEIFVSAGFWVSVGRIEKFLIEKSDFLQNALKKYAQKATEERRQYFEESEMKALVLSFSKEIFPYYKERGVKFPEIKFRKMVSQWGNCRPEKAVLTFNTNLIYAPECCIKYVVHHEFTHFLQANHSKKFYDELMAVCPEWKKYRKMLKEINLR